MATRSALLLVLFAAGAALCFPACGSDSSSDGGAPNSPGKAGKGGGSGGGGKGGAAGQGGGAGGSAGSTSGAGGQGGSGAGVGGSAGSGAGQGGSGGSSAGAAGAGAGGAGAGQGGSGGATGGQGGSAGQPPVCQSGESVCDGACVDTKQSTAHCGGCGKACDAGSLCCDGFCAVTDNCGFAVTGLDRTLGFQSGGEYLTIKGQGFLDGMKVFLGDGRAPVLVLSSTEARIQTPPGPLGKHDVTIEMTGAKATLPKAWTYISAGLSDTWEQKPLKLVRGEDPALAVMQDGRVLVAGGTTVPDSTADSVNTAEIYTRATDTVTQAANTMSTVRWQNSAVTLLDGRVLVVGGACHFNMTNCVGNAQLADLFDPKTNSFSPTGPLTVGRAYTRTALLPDGRILVTSANTADLEVFDPKTGTFTAIPHSIKHVYGYMVRLRDGRVMLGGGDGGNTAVEIFDPDTNTITSTGAMTQGRAKLTAHTLPDGRVMLIGGASQSAGGITVPLDTIELYDPKTGTFSQAPYKMGIGRTWHASALLRDGTVLAMGGYTVTGQCSSLTDAVDQIDPVQNKVSAFPKTLNKNCEWGAVTLLDGSVLGVGGGACGTSQALPDIFFLAGKE